MSINYSLGSRDMVSAARMAMKKEVYKKGMSFSTAATVVDRFRIFVKFSKEKGVGKMEKISSDLVMTYGKLLANKVNKGEISAAYAQNLVSAINTVLFICSKGKWQPISPTKDCLISKRSLVRKKPTVTRELANEAIEHLRRNDLHGPALVAEFALNFGLRSKEGSMLDSTDKVKGNFLFAKYGTKGGRKRSIPISHNHQIKMLDTAVFCQKDSQSLMPKILTWKTWRNGELRRGRDLLHDFGIKGFHELRATYAAERYKELTGAEAPVNGGMVVNQELDLSARKIIARELGHNRITIVSSYVGGRK